MRTPWSTFDPLCGSLRRGFPRPRPPATSVTRCSHCTRHPTPSPSSPHHHHHHYHHHFHITIINSSPFLHQASTKELKRHIAKKHVDEEGVYEALVAREAGEIRETEAETHLDINAKRLELNMKVEDSNVD